MATETATVVSATRKISHYAEYVNPQWVALLNLLEMSLEYASPSFWTEALGLARLAVNI
jgi:hypothetical protein